MVAASFQRLSPSNALSISGDFPLLHGFIVVVRVLQSSDLHMNERNKAGKANEK